ncbi:dUTP diphosphatase [Candidatus Nesciobacter abundans]|uniref:dUTP diphosphatase n=1 Tax=Candidatus Nesciobacter abundans TaxID=2601668 RepID=A0A5C0UG87_9PROT|nr:dUTP diphosphatase [Candidatus Nesciobacter abundans]QEK39078.1 dUTP diphosphatase [Candidatus Nesciobacter abundans]
MIFKIKLLDEKCTPQRMTERSAGLDLRAKITSEIIIHPREKVLVPVGFCMEIPEGYEAQIRCRSGIALKHGIVVLNSPGTIDCDYRDEVKVILSNLGEAAYALQPYTRIAQMVISKYESPEFQLTDKLTESERKGGFGSTGNK